MSKAPSSLTEVESLRPHSVGQGWRQIRFGGFNLDPAWRKVVNRAICAKTLLTNLISAYSALSSCRVRFWPSLLDFGLGTSFGFQSRDF